MFKRARLLTLLAFPSMFFLGVWVTLIGAAARNIGLSPPQIGMLIAVFLNRSRLQEASASPSP